MQYVDSELYTSTQGQAQMYPVYAVGDYTSGSQQYYTATGSYTNAGSGSNDAHGTNNQYIVPVEDNLLTARDSPQEMGGVKKKSQFNFKYYFFSCCYYLCYHRM